MVDILMLNGKQKGTPIVRFDHTASLIVRDKNGIHRKEFGSIEGLKEFMEKKKIEANVEHIFPASMRAEKVRAWYGRFPRKESQ